MKKKAIIALVSLIVVCFIPIIPVPYDENVWTKQEFLSYETEIDKASDKINSWTSKYRKHPRYKEITTYNLVCIHAEGREFKSLIGLPTGSIKTIHRSFASWIIPTVPFLEYAEESTAILDPENVEEFLAWVSSSDDYGTLPPELEQVQ